MDIEWNELNFRGMLADKFAEIEVKDVAVRDVIVGKHMGKLIKHYIDQFDSNPMQHDDQTVNVGRLWGANVIVDPNVDQDYVKCLGTNDSVHC